MPEKRYRPRFLTLYALTLLGGIAVWWLCLSSLDPSRDWRIIKNYQTPSGKLSLEFSQGYRLKLGQRLLAEDKIIRSISFGKNHIAWYQGEYQELKLFDKQEIRTLSRGQIVGSLRFSGTYLSYLKDTPQGPLLEILNLKDYRAYQVSGNIDDYDLVATDEGFRAAVRDRSKRPRIYLYSLRYGKLSSRFVSAEPEYLVPQSPHELQLKLYRGQAYLLTLSQSRELKLHFLKISPQKIQESYLPYRGDPFNPPRLLSRGPEQWIKVQGKRIRLN